MKHRTAVILGTLAWSGVGQAQEARVHASAAAAHAVGPPQQREFGVGGGVTAAVAVPVSRALEVQAGGGALVLDQGRRVDDPSLARSTAGMAVFGTLGIRIHLLGTTAGPWLDANAGLVRTGTVVRPSADAHLGWSLPVARDGGVHAGPVVGYTQVIQPESELRTGDARVVWAGLSVSFGGKDPPRVTPPSRELARRATPVPDEDRSPEVEQVAARAEDDTSSIRLVENRILLDDVIEFEFDSARIRRRSHPLVGKVARFLANREGLLEVSIEGHADAVGSETYNQRLSESRAESTRAMLVAFGVDPSRLKVVAHGASRLKVATQLPNSRNRRVEFIVTRLQGEASVQSGSMSGQRGAP